MMDPFRYRVFIEWSDEDECYVGRVPALPGVSAHGDTEDAAAREVRVAAGLVLDDMADAGEPPPPEDIGADYSGQVRLRMPKQLHRSLAMEAQSEGVSLNTLMVTRLSRSRNGTAKAG
ncbi:MAG TPA: type II toxin-antitoxin system HicB family antitoxin [Kofleriaceae bacterium]|nr:type II toxin-antitoxin system HicB family antitoxin [Kofleriaceae bacterium]